MRVLGVATDAATQWLRSVPPGTWILIAAVLLILVIIAVVVSIIARSWATAGLIFGISDASRGMPVSLVSTGPKGLTRTKHIAVYSVISILILAGVILSFLILLGIGAVFMQIIPPLGVIWMIVSGITAAAGIVLAALFTSLISVYAERLIVLHGYAPWPAWIRGLALSRTNFKPTVIMGLVNSAIGCVVGVVASIPLIASIVFAVVAVAVSAKRSGPTGPDSISLIPYLAVFFTGLILLLIVFQGVVNAALTVWRYGVWHQLFRNFVPEEEKPV
ncbi:hypothetical protein A2Z33_02155 [Candidatus Gottesmanbacteria bacterium RBG_16_52_11]|uniref:Glycerophosphoryl diester phosphodiesterase membrane domain-containing protein n=1 Tax=Candidatus Gottesmanbacteria bacterium RBG_16_52_11 TaxID=1798374 RepID=A0A1F5YQV5_9BACT|nr:MAG: hypothetical protein A2Z33_02155 [Candidatus Gottesmanbacteria bacterium RBG_16_52_11]